MASQPFHYVLIPGRHHALTRFQTEYFARLVAGVESDTDGATITCSPDVQLLWAVTSANHQNTRRNPIAANRREAAIELLSQRAGFASLVIPVVDVPATHRFADITVKSVINATSERIRPTPQNTVVATSTPAVAEMYKAFGYRIAPIELEHPDAPLRAWEVLMTLIDDEAAWKALADPASQDVFRRYGLDDQVRTVMADPIVGDEGSLTATRNYGTYAAAFERAAQRKWDMARSWIRPGRIVDIGCATGGMLEMAAREPRLAESDLYGIEVARQLYEECLHRKAQGAFDNPNTYFYQRNILSGAIFPPRSIDTTLSFALTHEIFSYGDGVPALRRFAGTIFDHTSPGGIWINSDVCGPEEKSRVVRLNFHEGSLDVAPRDLTEATGPEVQAYLDGLRPAGRFAQFAQDFRHHSGVQFAYRQVDATTVELALGDAMEFLTHYRYTDNWMSETHEQFNALNWNDWVQLVTTGGFGVDERSGPWRNEWMVENTFRPVAGLTDAGGTAIDWPSTHMLLVASRPDTALE